MNIKIVEFLDIWISAENGLYNKIEAKNEVKEDERKCSCPKTKKGKQFTCPWGGKCLEEGSVYKCQEWDKTTKILKLEYIGCTGGTMKTRVSKHINYFKNKEKIHVE